MQKMAIMDKPNYIHPHSTYTPELGIRICNLLATHKLGLQALIDLYPDLPLEKTILEWRFRHEEFGVQYARAKAMQIGLMAEQLIEDSHVDHYLDEHGNKRVDSGMVARQRLVTDNVKWLAARLLPRVYGDKLQTEVTVVVKHEDALGALE